ncbi:3-phosphoshikimate 1-carboxyvinyltransferase [Actinoplanes flavus]|uniref:3-phosphoshikimate 1-carboxyvinyltransferase n=1 Tax=Actinoplanes flavus TaxID=2820290 RepID=A0ABS3UEN6_9ACTN|nr:3-phosphoshikimate 1-carboxyvinyltransferase [Actinoplanes flavus]MBO3737235.1 3-phosphoshikimate 1-carboxyvinyltransferase [Actinoplanes flavus]
MPDVLAVAPLTRPVDATVRPPGSKSITNRALLCAALADGTSTLSGALFADDTRAMMGAVGALGATVTLSESDRTVVVRGIDPGAAGGAGTVDARQSGTTSRFLLPAAALLGGRTVVDGSEQLRARPFGPVLGALRQIGARVEELDRPGFLPAAVTGPAHGGPVEVSGHISSQFLSGLLMAGPLMERGIDVTLTSPLVSVPYVEMTKAVMAAFGVTVTGLTVPAGAYRPADYTIEPDASAASYFLGAAAITGGRVTVSGLGTGSLQGDVRFADVLERMGASVTRTADAVTVRGGSLRGIDVDMADISDTAQTLAAVAVFADGPTRVRGIGFIRGKETDRVGAVVTELRRAGIDAVEDADGFTIHPGAPRPTRFATYDDHRMAMSLSLIGLRAPGIEIADPGCVAKTYPGYFTDLATLA